MSLLNETVVSRIKVVDIDLSQALASLEGLEGYSMVQVLVRVHGSPIGVVKVPVARGRCASSELRRAIFKQHSWGILRHLLDDWLAAPAERRALSLADLANVVQCPPACPLPPVTIAVCTRDRTASLRQCLDALMELDYPNLDILIVDNAPRTEETKHMVLGRSAKVRYVREPRPGLNWARNRAVLEATGEIIAFTDDDAVVDTRWVSSLAGVFAEDPAVMAVTGLVVPYELETEAQILFEKYGGFGRGFTRRWCRVDLEAGERVSYHGTGQFGTGANMAFRRIVFERIGYFDPALDVGTVTNGGGELDMFFRVLKEGYALVYEPAAIVRHRHRREYSQLRTQLTHNGTGLYSYFVRCAWAYPEERYAFLRFAAGWLLNWNIRRLLVSFLKPVRFPRDLILAELRGCLVGLLGKYRQARQASLRIAESYGTLIPPLQPRNLTRPTQDPRSSIATAVRTVDIGSPLRALADVTGYRSTRIYLTWGKRLLGTVDFENRHKPINASRLREAIADNLNLRLLRRDTSWDASSACGNLPAVPTWPYASDWPPDTGIGLPPEIPVSIVVSTYDRPEDLRNCLRYLKGQNTPRQVEIVVVDNHPSSGRTPLVASEFQDIVLVREERKGLAYARNKGITASAGDIIVTTDDDVSVPEDWLEKLIAPFVREHVMAVTGNILPLELETRAQQLFEAYGGLGRGFEPLEADGEWFESFRRSAVPTWTLGATANAAFRASIFCHPDIGLMDEALGPGMPSEVGEDTYLFYKILNAGYTIAYEPSAYVWHRHSREMADLRRKIYNYSKGHAAYNLATFLWDHDVRGLIRLIVELPYWYVTRLLGHLLGRNRYPLSLILPQVAGNLAGPWSLWRSRLRVRRQGRSEPYIPVSQRTKSTSLAAT